MSAERLSEELGQLSTCAIGGVIRVHADTLRDLRDMALALEAESVADLVAAGWHVEVLRDDDFEVWLSRGDEYGVQIAHGPTLAAAMTALRKKIGGES